MNRKQFLSAALLLGTGVKAGKLLAMNTPSDTLSIRLLRNATLIIEWRGIRLLVDPLLSARSALDPVPWSNDTRNPTVELPVGAAELESIIRRTDAVLLTHLHRDHWDVAAQALIPKQTPIWCQPEDLATLSGQGFTRVRAVEHEAIFEDIRITRVAAQHGHGELAQKMAPVSGFILRFGKRTVYIAGDSVWYDGVENNIRQHAPDIVIVNSGAAQFNFGAPITMNAEDVIATTKAVNSDAVIIAVHLEAINHCGLSRNALAQALQEAGVEKRVRIPKDGETLVF